MYSRQNNGATEISVPPNYSGNAFRQRRANVHITPERQTAAVKKKEEGVVPKQLPPPLQPPIFEMPQESQATDAPQKQVTVAADEPKKESTTPVSSLLSPLGSLGTEEILLIALALIVFQSGKDPDLALILLALLFVN